MGGERWCFKGDIFPFETAHIILVSLTGRALNLKHTEVACLYPFNSANSSSPRCPAVKNQAGREHLWSPCRACIMSGTTEAQGREMANLIWPRWRFCPNHFLYLFTPELVRISYLGGVRERPVEDGRIYKKQRVTAQTVLVLVCHLESVCFWS